MHNDVITQPDTLHMQSHLPQIGVASLAQFAKAKGQNLANSTELLYAYFQ
jgi:hypothetical protein